jgi:hypothetical protein
MPASAPLDVEAGWPAPPPVSDKLADVFAAQCDIGEATLRLALVLQAADDPQASHWFQIAAPGPAGQPRLGPRDRVSAKLPGGAFSVDLGC